MKWSGLFSKTSLTVTLGAALGYFAATSHIEFPKNSVVATEPPVVTADDTVQSTDEPKSQNKLSDTDQVVLAKHNRLVSATAAQTGKKPNFLIIWGDDVGYNNPSAYNRG